jgi:cyclohexanone monooxygenase
MANLDLQHPTASALDEYDVVVVGAGFAGLYMLYRLRCLGFRALVYEQASGVGGTWYWNRYPGARCDVESMKYSYSFSDELQQEWEWTERYACQAEILRYANHVADRFDLRREIQFDTRVLAARFEESMSRWSVATSDGKVVSARFLIMATGCLSSARMPDINGAGSFMGKTYHTGHWPHQEVDFSGQRVGVIGTGSSAIQLIPVVAAQARHLVVFQRTPNFSIPAHNRPLTEETKRWWKSNYTAHRRYAREATRTGIVAEPPTKGALEDSAEDRGRNYEARWQVGGTGFMASYNDLLIDKAANETAAEFVRAKIAEIVRNPSVAKLLQPFNHPIGTKRICVDTGYYETFNRENVTLVDVGMAPIEQIDRDGLRAGGRHHALDAIVFATGFDAMTGALTRIDIVGRAGIHLRRTWDAGPRTYLGLMSAGFPNLFLVTGPGSPSVLSNMIVSIEQHVDWIASCIARLRKRQLDTIEATENAEEEWAAQVNKVAQKTLFPQANSWYVGANVPGKPRVFMPYIGGVDLYRRICNDIVRSGYPGFVITSRRRPATAAE